MRKKPNELDQGRTRTLILETAARMLCTIGVAGTTMRLIADASGIKAGSVYYHFQSKDDIVLEVLNEGILRVEAAVREALEQARPEATFVTRFGAAVRAHMVCFLESGDFTAANLRIFKQVPRSIQQKHLVLRRRYERLWQALLLDGVASGAVRRDIDPRIMKLFLLGSVNWAVEWYRPNGLSATVLADLFVELFLNGALARADGILTAASRHQRGGNHDPVKPKRAVRRVAVRRQPRG